MVRPLSLSVALCTRNGERFLVEQLDSIAAQTRLPDELVASDDASTDSTVRILQHFAATAPFTVRVTANADQVGSTTNFQRAIAAVRGEIVVLSDQDDVWRSDKLARIEAAFAGSPRVGCIFSDAEVVAEDLGSLGYRLWQSVGLDSRRQRRMTTGRALDVLLEQNVVTGATMAFRASLRDLVLPIPTGWVHDGWIALLVSAVTACVPLNEPLVRYRQHPGQQIGGLKRTLSQQIQVARAMDADFFARLARDYAAARDRLAASRAHRPADAVLSKLDGKVAHCLRRVRIRSRGRHLPLVVPELVSGRYRRYSRGWKSFASDLFL